MNGLNRHPWYTTELNTPVKNLLTNKKQGVGY